MKKFSVIAVIILLSGMFFTACEKNNETAVTNDPVLERILDFKADVENPSLKSGETISVEDAVWLVEAALNYTYCFVTEEQVNADLNSIFVDSLVIDIDVTDNQVNFQTAVNAYFTIEAAIALAYENIESEVKFYDVVDVEYVENQFKVFYAIVFSNVDFKNSVETKTAGWIWGWDKGRCDGTQVGRDGSDVIYDYVYPRIPQKVNVYYTDIDDEDIHHYDCPDSNNPYGDYALFYRKVPGQHLETCMADYEFSYYNPAALTWVNIARLYGVPQGYTFKRFSISWAISFYSTTYPYTQFWHTIVYWYGIAHTGPPIE